MEEMSKNHTSKICSISDDDKCSRKNNKPEKRDGIWQGEEVPLLSRVTWEGPLSCGASNTWQCRASEEFLAGSNRVTFVFSDLSGKDKLEGDKNTARGTCEKTVSVV